VRERPARVGPSAWEHVEFEGDAERVSALVLEPGGDFRATIWERPRESHGVWAGQGRGSHGASGAPLASAMGTWRPCRGGVELVFIESPELDLDEHIVAYRMRHSCLVADDAYLPDGLVQEYAQQQAPLEGPPSGDRQLLARMLADAEAARAAEPEALDAAPRPDPDDDDADPPLVDGLPMGLIEEGSSDKSERSDLGPSGRSSPRAVVGVGGPKEAEEDDFEHDYEDDFEEGDEDEDEDESDG